MPIEMPTRPGDSLYERRTVGIAPGVWQITRTYAQAGAQCQAEP